MDRQTDIQIGSKEAKPLKKGVRGEGRYDYGKREITGGWAWKNLPKLRNETIKIRIQRNVGEK